MHLFSGFNLQYGRRNVNPCIHDFRNSSGIWAYFDLFWGLFELISGCWACFEAFLSSFLVFGPVFDPHRREMLIRVSTISATRGGFGPILRPFWAHPWLLGQLWGLFELISGFWACFWSPQRRNVNPCIHNYRTLMRIWAHFDLFWGIFELISGFLGLFLTTTEEKC